MSDSNDFGLEKRLYRMDEGLHRRYSSAIFALQRNLSHYKLVFPEFADHTYLHSLSVVDFCNKLLGKQKQMLNPDEIFVLLMGCYLHDTGMGVSEKDFREFSKQLDYGDYFDTHSRDDIPAIIRYFHHELSGMFVKKYQGLFDFPSDQHCWAVVQIVRGHRRTDLMDESEYPISLPIPGGSSLCLPYLAALIRLADEIDMSTARNSILLYDIEDMHDEYQIHCYKVTRAIRDLQVTEKEFIIVADDDDSRVFATILQLHAKMRRTLMECRAAVNGRTPFVITQERVRLRAIRDVVY